MTLLLWTSRRSLIFTLPSSHKTRARLRNGKKSNRFDFLFPVCFLLVFLHLFSNPAPFFRNIDVKKRCSVNPKGSRRSDDSANQNVQPCSQIQLPRARTTYSSLILLPW